MFGLGSFGRSVALTLENLGCDVVVVDKSYEKIQEISDMVSYAMRADVSDPDALHALGGRNLDGAVVAVSESLEASIMATIISKEMGIPYVLAKAKDELQGAILEKVGADAIAYPECDIGGTGGKKPDVHGICRLDRIVLRIQHGRSGDSGKMGRKKLKRIEDP
mgnify:FL=1